jgi:hypothetical protein
MSDAIRANLVLVGVVFMCYRLTSRRINLCVVIVVQIELLTTLQLRQARQAMQMLLMASDIPLLTSKHSEMMAAGVQFRPPHLDVDVLQISPTWSQPTSSSSSVLARGRVNSWNIVLYDWQQSRMLSDTSCSSTSAASAAASSTPQSVWSAKLASSMSPIDMLTATASIEQVVHGDLSSAVVPAVC